MSGAGTATVNSSFTTVATESDGKNSFISDKSSFISDKSSFISDKGSFISAATSSIASATSTASSFSSVFTSSVANSFTASLSTSFSTSTSNEPDKDMTGGGKMKPSKAGGGIAGPGGDGVDVNVNVEWQDKSIERPIEGDYYLARVGWFPDGSLMAQVQCA